MCYGVYASWMTLWIGLAVDKCSTSHGRGMDTIGTCAPAGDKRDERQRGKDGNSQGAPNLAVHTTGLFSSTRYADRLRANDTGAAA